MISKMLSGYDNYWLSGLPVAAVYALTCLMLLVVLAIPNAISQTRFDNSMMSRDLAIRQLGGTNSIVQDGYGFIWVAGENGLGRYNGVNLRLYQAKVDDPTSLPSNYVWDIAVDKKGQLWVATSGGLCIYRPNTDNFELIKSVGGQTLLSEVITALAVKDDNVYLGSTFGLNIIDLTAQKVAAFVPSSLAGSARDTNTIRDISIDKAGEIWVATELGGVAHFNQLTATFEHFYYDKEKPDSISSNHVRSIYHDSTGRMWAGTYGGGLNIFIPETGKFVRVQYPAWIGESHNSVVTDILEDGQGDFWVSIDQQGLLRFDSNLSLKQHFAHSSGDNSSIISNQTRTLFQDINNDLWIGMFPFGVSFLDRSKEAIQTYKSNENNPHTLSNNAILRLLEDSDGIIWIGTEGGLNAFNPTTQEFARYLSDPANPETLAADAVLAIEEDTNGDLWIGTWSGGLHRLDRKTRTFKRYGPRPDDPHSIGDAFVWALLKDSDNKIWLGTETGGLQYYRPKTNDFKQYRHDPDDPSSISSNYVRDIIEDKNGRLWIATSAGLNIFDKETETFQVFQAKSDDANTLRTLSFFCMFEDSQGYIWAGGNDKGVIRINPETGEAKRLDVRDGLPSSTISSIQEDQDGYIWLATYNGLARLHPDTLTVTLVNIEHGLIGGTYNRNASLRDSKGQLYFGSTDGITVFNSKDIIITQSVHPILITNFRIFNQEVLIGKSNSPLKQSILTTKAIELRHADNMFSFDFVMLNYRNAHLNSYAYKLEGFDKTWNYVEQSNSATYTNLDPGRYIFHVKAKAAGEQWVEIDQPIIIDIAPPLWRSWWAYCFYLFLASALIYIIYTLKKLRMTSDNYKEMSLTDSLSGAYNRTGVAQIVQGLFANKEMKRDVCIMIMDIDHFKRVNDERGHNIGDHVIKELVRITKTVVREGDCLGRWGGEEFILLCPRSSPGGACHLAEKIRAAIAAHEFDVATSPLRITLSIGIALVHPDEIFEETLERADKALYQAKTSGRDRSVLANVTSNIGNNKK